MAGVRAGLNGMDEGKIIRSLEDTLESDTHPDGLLRAETISSGAQYAKEYMAINNEAPSFSECLERFDKKLDEMSGNLLDATQEINLKEEMSGNSELKAFVDDKLYTKTTATQSKLSTETAALFGDGTSDADAALAKCNTMMILVKEVNMISSKGAMAIAVNINRIRKAP